VDAWETLLIQSKEDDAPPCYHLVEKYSTDVLGGDAPDKDHADISRQGCAA
jgi:hypothetical protein